MTATAGLFTLRPPDASDRLRAGEIVRATGVFQAPEIAIALEVFDGATAKPGVDYHAIGAYDERGLLLGFACYGSTPCTEATWDLYWIAVDPAGHRRGVGRALMEAAEAAIVTAGGNMIVVETSSRSEYGPTHVFYERLGYRRTAQIPDFYAASDDLIVYTKRLVV